MFHKPLIFSKGGRAVIYETKEFAKMLPPDEKWRIVTFDLSNKDHYVDWTHEREWRVKGDLKFDYKDVYIILQHINIYIYRIYKASRG
jgi:hypothetical protein